jgi:hypothetical protein
MFNLLAYFKNTQPAMIFIVTGDGKENGPMTATRKGDAQLQINGKSITL